LDWYGETDRQGRSRGYGTDSFQSPDGDSLDWYLRHEAQRRTEGTRGLFQSPDGDSMDWYLRGPASANPHPSFSPLTGIHWIGTLQELFKAYIAKNGFQSPDGDSLDWYDTRLSALRVGISLGFSPLTGIHWIGTEITRQIADMSYVQARFSPLTGIHWIGTRRGGW